MALRHQPDCEAIREKQKMARGRETPFLILTAPKFQSQSLHLQVFQQINLWISLIPSSAAWLPALLEWVVGTYLSPPSVGRVIWVHPELVGLFQAIYIIVFCYLYK